METMKTVLHSVVDVGFLSGLPEPDCCLVMNSLSWNHAWLKSHIGDLYTGLWQVQ